jgi:zinc-ribbon domain
MFCPKCGTENPDNGKFCRSCGIDLGNASAVVSGNLPQTQVPFYVDQKGKIRSNDPNQIYSSAIKNLIMGVGFLVISIVLLTTNVAGGKNWWWAMLFPAFSMLASGASQFAKLRRIEKQSNATPIQQNTLPQNQVNTSLPPMQTDFIKQQGSIYETGNLVERPSSVTEGTTKLLKIEESE